MAIPSSFRRTESRAWPDYPGSAAAAESVQCGPGLRDGPGAQILPFTCRAAEQLVFMPGLIFRVPSSSQYLPRQTRPSANIIT